MAYLDYAGASQPSPELLENISRQLTHLRLANPHSRHAAALSTRQIVEETRLRILEHFNAEDNYEVVFTANATHALQIVGRCFVFSACTSTVQKITTTIPAAGPAFCYLSDSHNSVVGVREIVRNKVAAIACLSYDSIEWSGIKRIDNGLFMYTAASNFSGRKYPLDKIRYLQEQGWSVCLDAAAWASSSALDLSAAQPDFAVISFYKIFGYPTGIGCLLVRKEAIPKLCKTEFAGGTLAMADPFSFISHQKQRLSDRFEDGTINFYSIAALREAFMELDEAGGISMVQRQSTAVCREAVSMLRSKCHWNGKSLVEIYGSRHTFDDSAPIIAFNLKRDDGSYIGYSEVEKMCELFGVLVRTGCFCNIGACIEFLKTTPEMLHMNYLSGKQCGDEMDLLDGRPLGAVRISFGRFSKREDVNLLERVLDCCFLGTRPNAPDMMPLQPISAFQPRVSYIFYYPVKSASAVRTQRVKLSNTGFEGDRHFMVTSCEVTLTRKNSPSMCRLNATIEHGKLYLEVNDCIIEPLEVDLENNNNTHRSVVCENSVSTDDCGEAASRWLETVLELPRCRLLRTQEDSERNLANDAPILMINEASVQVLADVVSLTREEIIQRFRPNIVVRGLPAFMEDTAVRVNTGKIQYEVKGKCTRCEMICVDPTTGEKNPDLIVALRNFRYREKMTFGIYLRQINFEKGQTISEGDVMLFE